MGQHLLVATIIIMLGACRSEPSSAQDQDKDGCALADAFVQHVSLVLSDTTGRFATDYPKPTALTCEVLSMLHDELKDDSVRYHLDHLHQRYNDPRARAAFVYIKRHTDFPLAMALATHWNPDVRIEAVRAVNNYRRIRPMVCATQAHYAQLELQDRAAVRYFITVMETTPLVINGSENATIHDIYIRTVVETLDRFTGQDHLSATELKLNLHMSEAGVKEMIADWRNWLEQ